MASHAAVRIDDDLAAGEAGVADGAADHEAPGRVDEKVLVGVELGNVVHLARKDRLDHVLPEVSADLSEIHSVGVLRRDQDLLDADGRPSS